MSDAPRDVPAEGPATEDWRDKWDDIGRRVDRLAYLERFWPDLLTDIRQQARQAALDDVRREVEALRPVDLGWSHRTLAAVIAILDRLSGSRT